jgi:hypothetical protein
VNYVICTTTNYKPYLTVTLASGLHHEIIN